jgi:hypothetical protein
MLWTRGQGFAQVLTSYLRGAGWNVTCRGFRKLSGLRRRLYASPRLQSAALLSFHGLYILASLPRLRVPGKFGATIHS